MLVSYSAQKINGIEGVNLTTAGGQSGHKLVTFADHSGVSFYYSTGGNLLARRLDASGDPFGPEITIRSGTADSAHSETVLANGNVVVAWRDASGDILARTYSRDMQPIGSTVTLFDRSEPYSDIKIAATATGFAAVAQYRFGEFDADLHIKTFTAAGVLQNSNQITPTANDHDPSIAVLTNGDIVVSFTRSPQSDLDDKDVYYAIYSPTLVTKQAPIAASTAQSSSDSEVAARPDGGFVLSLSTLASGDTWFFARMQERSASGELLDSSISSSGGDYAVGTIAAPNGTVAAYIQGTDNDPRIQLLKPDGFIVGFALAPPSPSSIQYGGSIAWINNYTVQVAFDTATGAEGSDGSGYTPVIARYLLVRTWTDNTNSANDTMVGDDLLDVMDGKGGNDTLNGGGGPDTMRGGAGNDTYYVDNTGDVVDESSPDSNGNDLVVASISYKLPYAVERLSLGGTRAINGTGNELNNTLVGNSAANRLDGSFGADLMKGMGGNDSYVVDNVGDVVNEIDPGSGGIDTVYASIDYKLDAKLERLVLTGSLKLDGSGNSLANFIQGNSKANVLKGGGNNDTIKGGGGKDTIDGGTGKDIADYSDKTKGVVATLDGSHTVTVKVGGKAEDKIKNIEGLTGGSKADIFTGDDKANVFDGKLGKDIFTGGGGKDQFVFSTALSKSTVDTVKDFKHNTDKIALDDAIFKAIGGKLDKAEFYAKAGATAAHDSNDHIIYDKSTGRLYYDSDGKGGHAAVQFATLSGHPSLDHGDFIIV